jgi:calcineurin-like phosphoesterase family protein
MTIFVSADHHFFHRGVLALAGRPFSSIEEHNEALVAAWNATVGPRDEVWHLGDFALGGTADELGQIFRRLRGRKILVRGNHDKSKVTGLGWHSVHDLATPKLDGSRWVLCHYPMRAWPGAFRGARHCFGHTHGLLQDTAQSCDVGVDRWSYRPASLEEIRERMAATPEQPEEIRLGREMEAEAEG